MQAIFAHDNGSSEPRTVDSLKIIDNLSQIDKTIVKIAPKWPIEKMNKVDLAILRCAVWELTFVTNTPFKVVVDESIEIAKEFGTDTSPSFINGCLGSLLHHESKTNN